MFPPRCLIQLKFQTIVEIRKDNSQFCLSRYYIIEMKNWFLLNRNLEPASRSSFKPAFLNSPLCNISRTSFSFLCIVLRIHIRNARLPNHYARFRRNLNCNGIDSIRSHCTWKCRNQTDHLVIFHSSSQFDLSFYLKNLKEFSFLCSSLSIFLINFKLCLKLDKQK